MMPTTTQVRDAVRQYRVHPLEFDAWLARVKAEAFSEGVDFIDNDPSLSWGGSIVAGREEAARRLSESNDAERARAYQAGEWCGECRFGVVEDPPCCTLLAVHVSEEGADHGNA